MTAQLMKGEPDGVRQQKEKGEPDGVRQQKVGGEPELGGGKGMISNKTAAKIAELSAKTIEDRLKYTAYELVVEEFCLKRCGHTPDGELCDEAERLHRLFVALLFKSYSRSN